MRKYQKKIWTTVLNCIELHGEHTRYIAIPGDTATSRHFKTETEEFMKFGDGDSRILWSAKLHPARSCQRDNQREWPYQRCRQPTAAILTGSTLFRAWCKAPEKNPSGSRTRTAPSAVLLGTKFLNSRLVRALVPLLWGAAPVRPIESELNSSWAKIADFQIQFWLILVLVQDIFYHILIISYHILLYLVISYHLIYCARNQGLPKEREPHAPQMELPEPQRKQPSLYDRLWHYRWTMFGIQI